MTYQCPVCQRTFAEPGFCPFDGTPLVDPPNQAAPTQPGPGVAEDSQVRALSAHDGQAEAIATMRKQVSEYDRLIGETLDGRYYVERKIGEGGMGVVFAVKHAVIERPLAIKVLKRQVMRDGATVQRFIQEAKAASRIGHPNIVDVTDFGKTPDGMTYSVMEYIDGATLAKTIKHAAPMSQERAVRIAAQIARALAAAHGKGIVHRDLKPENVFLIDRDGRPDFVKIVDFGIAKVQPIEGAAIGPRLTQAGAVFGTPEYMAPEQAAGRGDTDHRVDIYALGTILYEMLVGHVPHKGESIIRTLAMQMLDPIMPPSRVNPELGVASALDALVMKALEKKREDRHSTMAELLVALEQLAAQLGATTRSPLSLPPLPPGADADLEPTPGVAIVSSEATAPRRARPSTSDARESTRPLHEPELASAGTSVAAGSVSFSHVYDTREPDRSRRWPMWVAGLIVLLLGAGIAILIMARTQRDVVVETPPAHDAARVAEVDAGIVGLDAAAVVEVPIDASTRVVAQPARDAGPGPRPGPRPEPRPGPRTITVEIMTRPAEAGVYIGPNFRGPSGVRIAEPIGTKRKIECKTDRMKGSVEVVFDGATQAVMCTATRERFCVKGIKNPWDDCEGDPSSELP